MNKALTIKVIQHFNFRNHPFPLFLYLEWLLILISLLLFRVCSVPFNLPFLESTGNVSTNHKFLALIVMLCFLAMGLKRPSKTTFYKLFDIGFGLLLILSLNIISGRGFGFTPTLLLVLLIRSCLIFQATGRILVALIIWILFIYSFNHFFPLIAVQQDTVMTEEDIENIFLSLKLNASVLFSFKIIFVLLLINTLISERQSRNKLASAHDKLRKYALKIEDQATLQERNRIAREIHDSLGHSLTTQSIQLENALVYLESNPDKAKFFLLEAKKIVANSLKEVRTSVKTLRSDPLKGQTLEAAITNLITEFQAHTSIETKHSLQINPALPSDLNQVIYRIVQEALTNISKHSGANEVIIDIHTAADSVCLRIDDNGVGFNPNQNTTGFGLQGMRERCTAFDGHLYINSKPGGGCNIIAFFPLSRLGA